MRFFKKNEIKLPLEEASKILNDVFVQTNQQPNTIPLEELESYSNYRRDRHSTERYFLIIILIVFLLLPFFFISPRFDIYLTDKDFKKYPTYEMRLTPNIIPVSVISANLNNKKVAVYETGSHLYSITPTENGTMTVSITLMNHQFNVKNVEIENIDVDPPVLISKKVSNGLLMIEVEDDGSGIDYDNAYAIINETNKRLSPVKTEKNKIYFEYTKQDLNVFIPDYKENTLQLILSVK